VPTLTGRFDLERGPRLTLLVMPSEDEAAAFISAGRTMPSLSIEALIDTGATATVLRAGLAASLGLQPVGTREVSTPTSEGHMADLYAIRLLFGGRHLLELTVVELPLAGQGVDCLIGRDILATGTLVYLGTEGVFSISL
jgi:predicted aspartyl protease